MYDLFISFGMHDTCMWFVGFDLSLAWRMDGIDSGLPSLAISWVAMVIVGLLPLFFLVGSHVSLAWVKLLVLEVWLNKFSGSPVTTWIELLVLEALVRQTIWKPLVG